LLEIQWNEKERAEAERLLRWGLDEDLGAAGDITSAAVIDPDRVSTCEIVARQSGLIAGLAGISILRELFAQGFDFNLHRVDGPVDAGQQVARCVGPTRTLLALERTMLNFLCRLSGVASLTARYVEAIRGTHAVICDTRKTTPGWRNLEKYAVRVGGGTNHRFGLFDAVLIKDNHLADLARHEAKPLEAAVRRARGLVPHGTIVEIEVDSLAQLEEALRSYPDIILLDNMSPQLLAEGVRLRDQLAPGVLLEASGGVHLDTVRAIAASGVERISVGAITHSAPVLDLALDDVPS
jgi:nicotinate-nucleotide pyrophosphorylase (carboxylating)